MSSYGLPIKKTFGERFRMASLWLALPIAVCVFLPIIVVVAKATTLGGRVASYSADEWVSITFSTIALIEMTGLYIWHFSRFGISLGVLTLASFGFFLYPVAILLSMIPVLLVTGDTASTRAIESAMFLAAASIFVRNYRRLTNGGPKDRRAEDRYDTAA